QFRGFPHAACRCYRPSEHAGTPGKARSCKYHRPAANLGQKGGHPVDVGIIPIFGLAQVRPGSVRLCQERPMATRASWKGYLKLVLVSCPLALYPAASSSERVSFNRINKKTGNRLKQQLVDAETGETVEKEDIGRGYEIGKGQYLRVEDEEIEKIRIESSHTISIETFVPRTEIDDRYIDDPYYIAPTDQVGQEA